MRYVADVEASGGIRIVSPIGHRRGAPAPTLPLLRHETTLDSAAWLQRSLTTFAERVGSFLPDHFAAYARCNHPFEFNGLTPATPGTWAALAARHGRDLRDVTRTRSPTRWCRGERSRGYATAGRHRGAARPPAGSDDDPGAVPLAVVWTGFGGSAIPFRPRAPASTPVPQLHLFCGPLAAARTTYDALPDGWMPAHGRQSATLVARGPGVVRRATEIDHSWLRRRSAALIAGILADPRLDAVATDAGARW
jgi:hypothetical protein